MALLEQTGGLQPMAGAQWPNRTRNHGPLQPCSLTIGAFYRASAPHTCATANRLASSPPEEQGDVGDGLSIVQSIFHPYFRSTPRRYR